MISTIWQTYEEAYKRRAYILDDYPLSSRPWITVLLTALYVLLVTRVGPRFMAKREPFKLKSVIIAYNALQMALCSYVVFKILAIVWTENISINGLFCMDMEDTPMWKDLTAVLHMYLPIKFLDWTDTFLFIARKKFQHVSAVQVFHHAVMPNICWFSAVFSLGGHGVIFVTINTFVHIFMYTYYLLSALGPGFKWVQQWKSYLTLLQISQFILAIIAIILVPMLEGCVPSVFSRANSAIFVVMVAFLVLFLGFYRKTYTVRHH